MADITVGFTIMTGTVDQNAYVVYRYEQNGVKYLYNFSLGM